MTEDARSRFELAFEAHHRAVLAYALRRVAIAADAEDAVAETFAVAWRRVDRMPDPEASLPWLLAVARRVVANQHRALRCRLRLTGRLRLEHRDQVPARTPSGPATEALEHLRPEDRELLRLLAWEGLSQAEAGEVLGISANAVAIRLHRARRRFADELARTKGSAPLRTSGTVEGRTAGRRSAREPTP